MNYSTAARQLVEAPEGRACPRCPATNAPPRTSRQERGTFGGACGGTPVRTSGANPAQFAGPPAACGSLRQR